MTVLAAFILIAPLFLLFAGERISKRIDARNQTRQEGQ